MSKCRFRRHLIDCLEGHALEHLESCSECCEELEMLQAAKTALLSVKRPAVPEGIRQRVMLRIRAMEEESSPLWRLLSRPGFAIAAVLLLFVMAAASLWISPAGNLPPAISAVVSPFSPIGVSIGSQHGGA